MNSSMPVTERPTRPYVLFVDDDPANLAVFEASCRERFPVLTASTAAQALELMRSHEVAVLLSDQRMPRTSGIELLEQVRQEFPDTIRMLVTAYSDLAAAIDAINRGQVRRYLRKPWEQHELRSALTEALELYRVNRKVQVLERRLVETERVYALGVVAASIAHEIRNPIGWTNNNVSLARDAIARIRAATVLRDPVGCDPVVASELDEADESLSDALEGLRRILEIVKGIELPTRDRADQTVDLDEVLRLTLRIVHGELRRCQIELDLKPVPLVRGSSSRLGQVVLNLVVNAVQALAEMPRAMSIVRIRLFSEDRWVKLEVRDTGPGIPPENLAKIFDPFFTTKRSGGTGLGLAISRTIVEELQGRLEAENAPEGGALFRILLPAVGE